MSQHEHAHTHIRVPVRVGPWALTVKVYHELTPLFKPICQGNYIIILQIKRKACYQSITPDYLQSIPLTIFWFTKQRLWFHSYWNLRLDSRGKRSRLICRWLQRCSHLHLIKENHTSFLHQNSLLGYHFPDLHYLFSWLYNQKPNTTYAKGSKNK